MSDTIKDLRLTKERLFEKGWRKGSFGPDEGPNCIVGALSQVNPSYFHLEAALRVTIDRRDIVHFNDHVDTSFDNIVDLIDATIKRLEGELDA